MNFFESLDSMDNTIESAPIGLKISTIEYSFDSFLQKIEDGILSDNVIQNNILQGYDNYLNYDNFKNLAVHEQFIGLWTNERFLKNFLMLMKSDKLFEHKVRTTYIKVVNIIAYDYFSEQFKEKPDVNWKKDICDLLLNIAYQVDYNYIVQMTTIMLNETARFITLSLFSSYNNIVAITRFNNMIIGCGEDISIKNIIYIYSLFFAENFSSLFNVSMTSGINKYETPEQHKNYDNISFALINILNSMPSGEIINVLKNYSSFISLTGESKYRFSLRNLSQDYYRINDCVEKLTVDGYIIP